MKRYIDADVLKIALLQDYTKRLKKSRPFTFEGVRNLIDNVSSADVQEVKHGKWISLYTDDVHFELFTYCSLCGKAQTEKSSYCPNCGARMDEEEKE